VKTRAGDVWIVGALVRRLAPDRNFPDVIVGEGSRQTLWIRARIMRASMVVKWKPKK
jgi:hypothetical protein